MTKFLRLVFAIVIASTLHLTAKSQSVSINTTGAVADPSAILDVTSTAKGVLVARMNKTEKNAIATPANGLLVYQTGPDSIGFHYYDQPNSRWVFINTNGFATDTTAWKLTGNNNVADTSFLGSINNKALKFRVYDTTAGIVDSTSGNTGLGYKALRINTNPGFYANTAMGFGAGQSLIGGYSNTAMGRHALAFTNGSVQNVAIGDSAMGRATLIGGTTAIGYQALKQINGLGFFTYNTAIGYASQNSPTGTVNGPFSYYNTSVGGFAMEKNMAGYENAAFGVSALRNNDSSAGNVAIGINAMFNHKRSGYNSNTAIGSWSMFTDSIGFWNTAIGGDALEYNKTGGVNTALGFRSMRNHVTGGENTALGVGTLELDSSGTQNTAVGRSALFLNKAASRNTVVGAEAGVFNNYLQTNPLQGSENTYVGFNTGRFANVGRKNAVVGAYALEGSGAYTDQPTLDAYSRNSIVGDSAALKTLGNDNVAMGFKALNANVTGSQHVAIGSRALSHTTATYPNTAVGYLSMDSATTNGANTAVGSYSLSYNKTGINNVALGNAAMYESTGGSNNTAVGNDAGRLFRNGQNTAIGAGSRRNDSVGVNNTTIGYNASYFDTTSQNVTIGASALRYNKRDGNLAIGFAAGNAFGFANGNGNILYGTENTTIGYRANQGNSTGRKNTVVGYRALAMAADGSYWYANNSSGQDLLSFNTAIGDSSQTSVTGSRNTTVGHATLQDNGFADQNTAMGDSAMANSVVASQNEAYGFSALKSLKNQYANGYWNTAIGGQAMEYDTSAYATIAMGFRALRNPVKVSESVALGVGAMEYGDSTFWNVAVGRGALFNMGNSNQNVAVGTWAMNNKKSGYYNNALGLFALDLDSIGIGNVGIGTSALRFNKQSQENVGLGLNAGYYFSGTGAGQIGGNVFLGSYAGRGATTGATGQYNNVMGYHALEQFTTAHSNVAIGDYSMQNNVSGSESVAIGTGSFRANKGTGLQSVAVGAFTLTADTSAGLNTAVGGFAAFSNTSGNANTAIGSSTLVLNTTGAFNTAVGQAALFNHQKNNGNVAVGSNAMQNDTTGTNNTAVGTSALLINSNGTGNTAIGRNAGNSNTIGTNNTWLGFEADVSVNNLTNATAIGYRALAAQSNTMILGSINGTNGATSDTKIGIRTTTPDSILSVADNFLVGSSGTVQYDNSVPVMSYMFKSGSLNADRMVIAHSPTFPNYGLQYQDATDKFNFLSGGSQVATIDLGNGRVGIDNPNPADVLHVGTTTGARIRIGSAESIEDFGTNILAVNANFYPTTNNTRTLGAAGFRWSEVFAVNGVINTSDAREKENINDLGYGLKEVMKLRPVSYTWKDNPQWGKKLGFIAQEVKPILGEVVQVGDLKTNTPVTDADTKAATKTESDRMGIFYSDIIPVAVKAIQEQQQIIEKQQKQIDELTKRLEKLEQKPKE